jgi:two-component system KDP operon response regulator KdpE
VLLVEDEPHLRRVLTKNLTRRGYRVTGAGTAAEALAGYADARPDVLVLDINLPDATGWDVLRGIQSRGLPRPSVVALSAVPPLPSRLAEFGPICFLQKPFAIDTLLRAVEQAVRSDEAACAV